MISGSSIAPERKLKSFLLFFLSNRNVDDLLSVGDDRQIGIMSDDDDLTPLFGVFEKLDEDLVDARLQATTTSPLVFLDESE